MVRMRSNVNDEREDTMAMGSGGRASGTCLGMGGINSTSRDEGTEGEGGCDCARECRAVQWAIHEGGCQTQETGLPAATSEGRKEGRRVSLSDLYLPMQCWGIFFVKYERYLTWIWNDKMPWTD